MSDPDKIKDVWDKLAALTPLIIGLAVTGVGAIFTHLYNFHQLQLSRIQALDKLRSLLVSEKPEDREFGYASFVALGYEKLAIRLIALKKDESGRSVLTQLQQSGSPEVKASAGATLEVLDAAQKLVTQSELGTAVPDAAFLRQHPEYAGTPQMKDWTNNAVTQLGISSKLGSAVLYETAYHIGPGGAQRLVDAVSKLVSPPLDTREKESAWLNAYLDERDKKMRTLPHSAVGVKRLTDRLRNLIKEGDWELKTLDQEPNKVADPTSATF